jgi:hypothetical protein
MDHALLVGVLHALANTDEQRDARIGRHRMRIAVRGDRAAGDELHREKRMPVGGGVGIEDLGDGRVAHLRQQLALDLEIGQVAGIQFLRAQQLDRHRAPHRLQLLGAIHLAHATAAEQAVDAVTPKPRA